MHHVSKIPRIMTRIFIVFLLAQPSHQGITTIQITFRFNNVFTETQRNGQEFAFILSNSLQLLCTGSKDVIMLNRKEVGNPIKYFDRSFDDYKKGFNANGK